MYSTVKEVHIVVYQRLQQMSSNRYQSIAPQFVDMVLNSAMTSVIRKKFDDRSNYKREGFEDSVQRYDDLQSLKRFVDFIQFNPTDTAKGIYSIDVPIDYMNLISCTVDVQNAETLSTRSSLVKNSVKYSVGINTNKEVFITVGDITHTCPLGEVPTTISSSNSFIFKNSVANALKVIRDKFDNNIEYTRLVVNDDKSIECDIIVRPSIPTSIPRSIKPRAISDLGRTAIRLVSSTDKDKLLENHYYIVNAHKAPLATIRSNKIVIENNYRNAKRYPNLSFSKPSIEYLAYPIEFNITSGTFPNLSFIDDVINTAVSELLLMVKDPTVNLSKQSETQI